MRQPKLIIAASALPLPPQETPPPRWSRTRPPAPPACRLLCHRHRHVTAGRAGPVPRHRRIAVHHVPLAVVIGVRPSSTGSPRARQAPPWPARWPPSRLAGAASSGTTATSRNRKNWPVAATRLRDSAASSTSRPSANPRSYRSSPVSKTSNSSHGSLRPTPSRNRPPRPGQAAPPARPATRHHARPLGRRQHLVV
jgi:hypothetical protein